MTKKHKGLLFFTHGVTGRWSSAVIDLPIETYITPMVWGMDMLRKINEHGQVRNWLLKIILGRYAYRELVGMRDSIEKHGWDTRMSYSCEHAEYNKDKVNL